MLDGPAVGSGETKQAAVVTIPAATPPTGREHLLMDEVIISEVLRREPSQHARLHLLHKRELVGAVEEAQTFLPLEMQPCLVLMCTSRVCERSQL